ncbi:hypothetical protein JAAARDRAFT_38844 [Jaapia argillacea MUCL 33604]|uniref:Isomerase YbhE n=1 Tax=Jaapia argillacea MUCL 33604 TaxID=933084 RepID=A0A067PGF0_9AGAM|nr:hypothetical protein JAAARDRAFT_38844 [Jaapia argillacea MUCL 33604]
MVNFTILAGGYTSFVASYLFNTDTSSLTLLNQSPTGNSPSWITTHPTNKSILYAVNELTVGMLQSYIIGAQGVLTGPVDQTPSGGSSPAFTAPIITDAVAIMNYGSGDGMIIPTTTDPLHFGEGQLITFPVDNGGVSHPHMAVQYGPEIIVPDLGQDKLWRLTQNATTGEWYIQGDIQQPTGSGPRHMALHGNNSDLYVIHELASTLTAQVLPMAPNGTTPFLSNYSTLPPTYPNGSAFAAAEILIPTPSANFPGTYIYTSNRNTGNLDPNGDTIVIWEILPTGAVQQVKQVYTGLDQIRGMMFSWDVDNGEAEYLIAAGYAGTAGVHVYQRINGGADLALVASNTDIPTRTSFVWLKA